MSGDELRAAAERIRRCNGTGSVGETILEVYCPRLPNETWTTFAFSVAMARAQSDEKLLAGAWLDEHPADDDTPIDLLWWLAMAVVVTGIDSPFIRFADGWSLFFDDHLVTMIADHPDGDPELPLPHIKTRGQARRLLAALTAQPTPAVSPVSEPRRWSTLPMWTLTPDSIGVWLFHPHIRSTSSPLAAYEFESVTNAMGTTLRCVQGVPREAGLWYGPMLTGRPPDELWEQAVPVVSASVEGTVQP